VPSVYRFIENARQWLVKNVGRRILGQSAAENGHDNHLEA
jgi:hypothetical protein